MVEIQVRRNLGLVILIRNESTSFVLGHWHFWLVCCNSYSTHIWYLCVSEAPYPENMVTIWHRDVITCRTERSWMGAEYVTFPQTLRNTVLPERGLVCSEGTNHWELQEGSFVFLHYSLHSKSFCISFNILARQSYSLQVFPTIVSLPTWHHS